VPCEGQPLTLHWLLGRLGLGADLKERHAGHVQRFTHRGILDLLRKEGFLLEKVTYSMHPLGQVRDILTYLEQEAWFPRRTWWRLLYRALGGILWAAAYGEARLLLWLPWSAVALHITARKP